MHDRVVGDDRCRGGRMISFISPRGNSRSYHGAIVEIADSYLPFDG
jgi:hypothetical protein